MFGWMDKKRETVKDYAVNVKQKKAEKYSGNCLFGIRNFLQG
jgi:hypothetical protein